MFIVIHYTEKRIVLLKNSNDIDESLEYFIRNTGSNRKEVTKKMLSDGFYERSNIYILGTNHSIWSKETRRTYGISNGRFENIKTFVKIELRNIIINNIIS